MPKDETKNIQNFISEIGRKLGFYSEIEYSFKLYDNYEPRYDVVWFIDLTKYNIKELFRFDISDNWKQCFFKHPIATFEIEGSTTSSKNQVGNFANVMINPSKFNFIVVNNSAASNENDTYRRGIKIYRTIKDFFGHYNIIFCDWSQLSKIDICNINNSDKIITLSESSDIKRSGVGGESKSIPIFDKIIEGFINSGLSIQQNVTPMFFKFMESYYNNYFRLNVLNKEQEYLIGKTFLFDPEQNIERKNNKFKDYYYLPKLDLSINFNIPISFNKFLLEILKKIGYEFTNYPLLCYVKENYEKPIDYSLLSIEIETSTNKHMNGGIINCSKYSFAGLLISSIQGKYHLEMLKKYLGLSNLFFMESR